jgi:hypothetical protein
MKPLLQALGSDAMANPAIWLMRQGGATCRNIAPCGPRPLVKGAGAPRWPQIRTCDNWRIAAPRPYRRLAFYKFDLHHIRAGRAKGGST